MTERLRLLQPEPISQQASSLLTFPVSTADTQSQLVLSETEPTVGYSHRHKEVHWKTGEATVCVCVCQPVITFQGLIQSRAKERKSGRQLIQILKESQCVIESGRRNGSAYSGAQPCSSFSGVCESCWGRTDGQDEPQLSRGRR